MANRLKKISMQDILGVSIWTPVCH